MSRSDDRGCGIDDDDIRSHEDPRDYDVLCVEHLPDSSLFSDISDDHIGIVAPAIVKRCVEIEKGDKNSAAGEF